MSFKNKIRKLIINISGYWIYKKRDLPTGIDFKEDLINKFNINPVLIFDVGANYGQTALYYNELFPNAVIMSFEPVKSSYERLIENIKGFKNISGYNVAFGEEKKELEISLFEEANSQLNSLKEINSNKGHNGPTEIIQVLKLNDFLIEKKISQLDLLKIDTEGFELEVLNGAENILKNNIIKAILCEVALSKRNSRNTQLNDVISFLDKFDYFLVGFYDTNINYFKEGLAYSNALFVKK